MIPIPAVDIRRGRCVQLVGGDPANQPVARADPVAEATGWQARGAPWLHVVDLDRALGEGTSLPAIRRILDAVDVPVQVGGGVRTVEDAQELLDAGAARVVVGTRAVTDDAFLRDAADALGERLVVAVDARGDEIVVKGWTRGSGRGLLDFARRADALGLGGFLYTDVAREGRMGGANAKGVEALASAVDTPVIASGGVTTLDDLRALRDAGAWGAVIGMAIYTDTLDYADALEAMHLA